MRSLRVLRQGVWYEVYTRINNREPLFRRSRALGLFARVFRETAERFAFEVRQVRVEDDWLRFYIKPADGMELPWILKWLKQTFAQRYNRAAGRIGHLWGDRYGSRIVEGEPPEEEGVATETSPIPGVRPPRGNKAENPVFPTFPPSPSPPLPAKRRSSARISVSAAISLLNRPRLWEPSIPFSPLPPSRNAGYGPGSHN